MRNRSAGSSCRLHHPDVTQITRQNAYQREQSFWWPWAQPIAAIGNPQAAASKISYVLSAAPGTCHE